MFEQEGRIMRDSKQPMISRKLKVAILGTGNIGSDLLMKVLKSKYLECSAFVGRNLNSKGMQMAKQLNVPVSDRGVDYIIDNPECCELVFDATTALSHMEQAPVLEKMGKMVIDLTPSHRGRFCIPVINKDIVMGSNNVNMVTCGGQATVPIIHAIAKAQPDITYAEVVATIASHSAGIGTRNNIDEFTETTAEAISFFSGIENTKAIIVLNPAEPPITMHATIFTLVDNPDMFQVIQNVKEVEKELKRYVPGYKIIYGPAYKDGRITTIIQVEGRGDYLPKYSGNLDIITCAAVETAEQYAKRMLLDYE